MARAWMKRLFSCVMLLGAAVVNVGWNAPVGPTESPRGHAHVYRTKTRRALDAKAHPEKPPTVTGTPGKGVYYGGRVISNVNVVPVFWTSAVETTVQSDIGAFLTAITASPYIDWLEEYDTIGLLGSVDMLPGSNQHIGRGTASAAVTITPMNTSTALSDGDVESELIMQLGSGALPAPTTDGKGNVNSLYMVEFPDGYGVDLLGLNSCTDYCGYHFTFKYGSLSVPYAVMPGLAACGGCLGGFASELDAITSIHSHELMEAITDTEVGFTEMQTTEGRPLGWYDPVDNMELADICDPYGPAPGVTGGTATISGYTVQLIWSNFAAACVAEIPICDGSTTPPACRPCTLYDDGVDCTGATPVCQTSATATNAGQCVGCVADSTCALPTPICDLTSNVCRACIATDCTGKTPLCSPSGACVQCDGSDHAACTGKTPLCDEATNQCVGCRTSKDCSGDTPVCNTKSNACQGCMKNSDCSHGRVCDTSKGAEEGSCVDCNKNADCKTGFCDTAKHTCATPPPVDAGHDAAGGDAGDAGPAPPSSSGGCACRAAPTEPAPGGWVGFLLGTGLAFVGLRRRGGRSRKLTGREGEEEQ